MTPEANNTERIPEPEQVTRAQEAQRARDCARIKSWQHAQRAKGQCRCGARIAPESRSRCWECLERCRRNQAAARGRPVRGRRRRGRPILGSLGVRRTAFEREEQRRAWRRERQAERLRERRLRRYT